MQRLTSLQPEQRTKRGCPTHHLRPMPTRGSRGSSLQKVSPETDAQHSRRHSAYPLPPSRAGNEYFCEVDEEYIVDRFNLTGLNAEVPGYSHALELITDTAADDDLNDEQRDQLETSARHLYGLIHARFIITSRGLAKMVQSCTPPPVSQPSLTPALLVPLLADRQVQEGRLWALPPRLLLRPSPPAARPVRPPLPESR